MKFNKRHLAKTITWRTIGSLDTLLFSWIISGNLSVGLKISGVEVVTKMILYYGHERLWFNTVMNETNKRHVLKTVSWRAVGTIDTFILAWVIIGNPLSGLKIGVTEVFTKMILYYFHEKIWYKFNFGLDKRNKIKNLKKQKFSSCNNNNKIK